MRYFGANAGYVAALFYNSNHAGPRAVTSHFIGDIHDHIRQRRPQMGYGRRS
jgi:hypothetical protein